MPEPLVIDASVAVKWFVAEADSERALELARHAAARSVTLHAPEIWVSECANAIRKRVIKLRLMDRRTALEAVARLVTVPIRDAATRTLLPRAYAIAAAWNITVYDALYVALAEALETRVVTADRTLLRRMGETPLHRRVVAL